MSPRSRTVRAMTDNELREQATYKAEPADGGAWTLFARTGDGAWLAIETVDSEDRAVERLGELVLRDHVREEHGHDGESHGWLVYDNGDARHLDVP